MKPAHPQDRAVTAELLTRFDRPGPRYTSYPTAVEFHDGVGPDDYVRLLAEADRHASEPPLALHPSALLRASLPLLRMPCLCHAQEGDGCALH